MGRFRDWIQSILRKMLDLTAAKNELGREIALTREERAERDLWAALFADQAPWLDSNTRSLGVASIIAGEFARLVTVETAIEITGGARARYLSDQFEPLRQKLRQACEIACAGGSVAFKPVVSEGRIWVDIVPSWRFFPTTYSTRGEITGAVFVEQLTKGTIFYSRLEVHTIEGGQYAIRQLCYRSASRDQLGMKVSLTSVEEWAGLEPNTVIRFKNGIPIEKMLFAYFKMPFANNKDPGSPLGVSVYSRAVDLMHEADRQYSRILWEFEGSELAVDASAGALMIDENGGIDMPEHKKRLFRNLNIDGRDGTDLYQVFSPEIRDTSLYHGLDQLLRRIEFACYLSYGTISDPETVAKTAEEIKTSKQRSFSAVGDVQRALEFALKDLLWAMDFWANLFDLAPVGNYDMTFTWGDGVLEDNDKEFQRRKAMVDSGLLKPEKLISWYFGFSEEEALEMIPSQPQGTAFPEG